MRCLTNLPNIAFHTIAVLLCSAVLMTATDCFAVDGTMGVVTGNPGKIMDGDKVLAEVPKGTQLWMFSSQDGWIEVKVPNQELFGWIDDQLIESVKLSEQQKLQLKEAYAYHAEYLKLNKEAKYAAAFVSLKKCYELERSIKGSDHPDVADTLSSMGHLASAQEDYPAAIQYYNESLAIRRKVLGKEHLETASVLHNLGSAYDDHKDYTSAQKYYDEALAVRRKILGDEHERTADTLFNLGILAQNKVDNSSAQKYFEEALSIRRKLLGNEHLDVAKVLKRLGDLFQNQKNYSAASKYHGERLAIMRKQLGNDHLDLIAPLTTLGYLALVQDDYQTSRKYYLEVLALERKLPVDEQKWLPSTLITLGNLSEKLKDITTAKKYYEEALSIRRKVLGNENAKTGDVLIILAVLAEEVKDYPSAQQYYEEALAIRRKVLGNEHEDVIRYISSLGIIANAQRDFQTAIKYHGEALALKRKVLGNEHEDTALTLGRLGHLSIEIADYPAARKHYEEVLAIRRKVLGHQHQKTAETLNNLGIVAREQGDYLAAQKYYDEALAINRKVLGNNHPNTASMINNMGNLAMERKDYPTARKLFEEALAIKRQVLGNQHEDTAQTLNNLGNLSKDQGDQQAARRYYEEALAINRKVFGNEHPSTAAILNNLAILAETQKDFSTARKQYEEALVIKRKLLGDDHPDIASTLYNYATMARTQKDYIVANNFFDQSRRIVRSHVQRSLTGLSDSEQVNYLENIYLKAWMRSLSFGWEQQSNPKITETSASWLINGKAVAQESLAARALMLRDATNPELAPLVKELTTVRQQLATQSLSTPKPSEAIEHQKKRAQLTADEQRLSRLLSQTTGKGSTDKGWIELDAIRQALPADALYVDLVRMEIYDFDKGKYSAPHYLAWIIPAGKEAKLQILDMGEAAPIEKSIEQIRQTLAEVTNEDSSLRKNGEAAAVAQANNDLQTIANLVLKPLLPQLADKKQLLLSPDGPLWLLPWAALPVGNDKLLMEQCSLRFVLSGRDLVKQDSTSKLGIKAPAIVVNPDYDLDSSAAKTAIQKALPNTVIDETETRSLTSRSSLPRVKALPFTSLEGRAAQPSLEQLAKSTPIFYEQDQALEAVVKKLQRPKHLLLSTHGFFLPDQEVKQSDDKQLLANNDTRALPALTTDGKPVENPLLRCGLLLAGCNSPRTAGLDDGILTGLEIVGMDLRGTELVVLSACETGIGKVRNGEGVAGLRQAFQLAGAQSVVSTLWQVPDRDSAIIMQDFFTNLAAGQNKADALRNAQLKRIAARKDKFGAAHPFFWAAWTVTGE